MSVEYDTETTGRARVSFAREADIDEFVAVLEQYERGDLSADAWRKFRLVRGTYGQRQPIDAQMLRVKIPQGILDARQLHALADVAESYSRGFGHITTRQNIQFHFVRLHDVELAMRHLADAGMTTREACGNSVRNVTACQYAGVSADEVFDVTPYADAFTRYFLRHPLSGALPRKFKVAFEGCPEDHAFSAINDIGFQARIADGVRGFRVLVAGGTSILCNSGQLLYDFVPASEMFNVAEAVVRVFHRFGDFEHKQRNRLKFLLRSMGWERWRAEYERALEEFRAEGGARLPFDPEHPPVEGPPAWRRPAAPTPAETAALVNRSVVRGPGIMPEIKTSLTVVDAEYDAWARTNTKPQKQPGYRIVIATVRLGDLTGEQMRALASLTESYSDGTVRITADQNLVFRWVATADVPQLYRQLAAAGLGFGQAGTIADVTSCPGAESCKLAVTQSRGLGRLLTDRLRADAELRSQAPDAVIKISGCPNGCGQHHIATIGFQGSVRKVAGQAVPQYFVMVGGGLHDGRASFGRLVAKIPARRAPQALERLLALYREDRLPDEPAQVFFRRVDPAQVKLRLADLEKLAPEETGPDDFIDLGESTAYVPEIQEGECSA
jgi:sulfite reductase (NADPH) hemoprotein beta-component